ncbi:MAG: TetR/AcrR family transcriptional regulator, partial [Rubricella sp.]
MFDMPASDPAFRTLAAAERILILSGEEALSARAIARETGLSTKVIYTYFKGMDGLVDVLRRSAINRFTQDLEAIGNSVAAQGNGVTDQDKKGNSVSGRLRAQIRHYIALAGMEPSRAMLLFAPDARNRTIR